MSDLAERITKTAKNAGIKLLPETWCDLEAVIRRVLAENGGVPRPENANAQLWYARWREEKARADKNEQFRGLYEAERKPRAESEPREGEVAPPKDTRKILAYACVNPQHTHHNRKDLGCQFQPVYADDPETPREGAVGRLRHWIGTATIHDLDRIRDVRAALDALEKAERALGMSEHECPGPDNPDDCGDCVGVHARRSALTACRKVGIGGAS